jgi:hypothetical protein
MISNRTPTIIFVCTLVMLAALLFWFGAYGPIWRASWAAQPADWLGFAGSVIGGLMTFCAAGLAWMAVRMQIRSDHEIAARGHYQAMRAVKNMLRPLLECLDVLWTAFDETLAFQGTDEEKLSRTTWLKSFHYTMPPETIVTDLRKLSAELDKGTLIAFENVLLRISNTYKLAIKYSEQGGRADELNWRMQDIKMLRLQIALVQDSIEKFEPNWTKYLGQHEKVVLNHATYADVTRDGYQMWKEEEARRRQAEIH